MSKPTNTADSFSVPYGNTLLLFDDQLLDYNNFLREKKEMNTSGKTCYFYLPEKRRDELTYYTTSLQSVLVYLRSSMRQICQFDFHLLHIEQIRICIHVIETIRIFLYYSFESFYRGINI